VPKAETSDDPADDAAKKAAKAPAKTPAKKVAKGPASKPTPEPEPDLDDDESRITGYGIASAVLGVLCVGAIVLTALMWVGHRNEETELEHQGRVAQVAVDWTGVLINMNSANVDASLEQLREGTVGSLNTDFDRAILPFSTVVKTLQSTSRGQIDSVSIERLYRDLDRQPGSPPPPDPVPDGLASRTDTVLIVATSVSENVGVKPQVIRWNLRVSVSEVDGKLLVSRLASVR